MTTPAGRFDYFMLRLTRSEGDPDLIAGLAELLRTGEKRGFESGEQLLRLIGEWSTRNPGTTGSPGPAP
jgi:hypothetical protein